MKRLRLNTKKSPCCKTELSFKLWNGIVRMIDVNGNYSAKCTTCNEMYDVKAEKNN